MNTIMTTSVVIKPSKCSLASSLILLGLRPYQGLLHLVRNCRRRWRLISAQLSHKFGHCPSCTVSIVCHLINTTAFHLLFKMGQSRPLFVYFRSFLFTISIIQIEKRLEGVLGIRTRSHRMVSADKTTELWQDDSAFISC